MNKSIFSRIIIALLVIAIPSQGLWAAEIVAPELSETPVVAQTEKGRIKQMSDAMKSFQKSTTSFLNCMATGKCETEKQEKLAAEVTYWSKRVMFLLAIMGASWFVKVQAVQGAQQLGDIGIRKLKEAKQAAGKVKISGPLGFEVSLGAETDPEFVSLKKAEENRKQQLEKDLKSIQDAAQKRRDEIAEKQFQLSKKGNEQIVRGMNLDTQERALKAQEAAIRAKQQELEALEKRLQDQATYYGVETQQKSGWWPFAGTSKTNQD